MANLIDFERYSLANIKEISINDFRQNPSEAFNAVKNGERVFIRDNDGSIVMRMSPEFND